MLSVLVGVISALGAAGFFYALAWAKVFCFEYLAGFPVHEPPGEQILSVVHELHPRRWVLFLLPAIGGLLSGWLVYTFAPEAEGHGTDAMIDSFHNKEGFIRARIPYIKALASLITLSTGGSAGREGPIAQIGAGIGSFLGQVFKLDIRERRILLLAGTAGGLGAIFRAPLGGALTSIEVLYKEDFETEAAVTSIVSSVVAYVIFTMIYGHESIFSTVKMQFVNPSELIFYAILGLICAPLGYIYTKTFYGSRDYIFRRIPIKKHYIPAIGGLGVGAIGLFMPEVMGGGYMVIQHAILSELSIKLMLGAIFLKMITTSFTISSGGSGGVFGPTLFIGGMIGGVVGQLSAMYFPEIVINPGTFVLVGMAAFFAGVANAPMGAMIMVCEMTGSYGLLAPLMLVSVIAQLLSHKWSIYEKQVMNKFNSPAHIGDMTINVLQDIKVRQIFRPEAVINALTETTKFKDLKEVITRTRESYFPVINAQGDLTGILNLHDIRYVLFEDALSDLVVVGELSGPPVYIRPEDDLFQAMSMFIDSGYGQLPVVDTTHGNTILGLLAHEDVIAAYREEIKKRGKG